MDRELLLESISTFRNIESTLSDTIKLYVQTKSFPLKDRWDVFSRSGFGDTLRWIHHFKGTIDLVDIHDYDYDRHQIVNVVYEVENLEKDHTWELEHSQDVSYSQNDIDALKEEILDEFLLEFEVDW